MAYCDYVKNLPLDNIHRVYHDFHYGVNITNDNELFGRLILEINQAGLSWNTILNKQENFRKAFDNYSIEKIAGYDQVKIDSLLNDAGIIRNKLKIAAVIFNAQQILVIQKEFTTFREWIEFHSPKNLADWVKIFRSNFKFVGGEIVNEFLMSIGVLAGAHIENCPCYKDY